jgi:hypothetical protein
VGGDEPPNTAHHLQAVPHTEHILDPFLSWLFGFLALLLINQIGQSDWSVFIS